MDAANAWHFLQLMNRETKRPTPTQAELDQKRARFIRDEPVSYQVERLYFLSISALSARYQAYKMHKKSFRGEKKKEKADYKKKKAGYKDLKKTLWKTYIFFVKNPPKPGSEIPLLATQFAKIHDEFEKKVVLVLREWRDNGTEPEVGFYGLAWKTRKCRKAVHQLLRAADQKVVLKVEVETAAATESGLASVTEADRPVGKVNGDGDGLFGGIISGV